MTIGNVTALKKKMKKKKKAKKSGNITGNIVAQKMGGGDVAAQGREKKEKKCNLN